MQHLFESLGWYVFLCALVALAVFVSKSLLSFVLDKGSKGEEVYFPEVVIAFWMGTVRLVSTNKVAFLCALSIFSLIGAFTDSSIFAALGYASVSYLVGGVATPLFMRKTKNLTEPAVAPATAKVQESPQDSTLI